MISFFLPLILLFTPEGTLPDLASTSFLEEMAITIPKGKSREFIFTNKEKAFFTQETSWENTRSYHGLFVELHKFLEDYTFKLGEISLKRREVDNVTVYPDRIVRHSSSYNSKEEITLLDGFNILLVQFSTDYRGTISLTPKVDFRGIWEITKPEYKSIWNERENTLLISTLRHPERTKTQDFPVFLGVKANLPGEFVSKNRYFPTVYPKDARRRAMERATPFEPGDLIFNLSEGHISLLFIVGDSENEVYRLGEWAMRHQEELKSERRERMEGILRSCAFETENQDFNKALRWAILSLDALLMNQRGIGLYAGLHWFPSYWGRDTFISLPGATLVRGMWDETKRILENFGKFQKKMGRDKGRIPNFILPGQITYNSVDGTLWFLREIREYLEYSGDTEFARTIFPTVKRAIEGYIAESGDENYFITHGEAETWMDAGGETNPFSPRGNRAVEVQALWYESLLSGASVAKAIGDETQAKKWEEISRKVKKNFQEKFWNPESQSLYDHLNPDGTPDQKIRPNQILAITVPANSLLDREKQRMVVEKVHQTLVYPHGVGTLSPQDPQFHPVHINFNQYHFDEAYHNGDVWPWLSGPMITALVRFGKVEEAYKLTQHLTNLILHHGAVGTLPELENGVYQEGEDNLEGTISQAWSLAEFIRVFFQDYLGFHPHLLQKEINIEPAIPEEMGKVRFQIPLAGSRLEGIFHSGQNEKKYSFFSSDLKEPLRLNFYFRVPKGEKILVQAQLEKGKKTIIVATKTKSGRWRVKITR